MEERLLRVCLDQANKTDLQSRNNFCFCLEDLPRPAAALRFPAVLYLENESKCTSTENMCELLRRLLYPCRVHDLEELFGKSSSSPSRMLNRGLEHIITRYTSL